MRAIITVVLALLLVSCQQVKSVQYINLPHPLKDRIPSLIEDMFLNLTVEPNQIPSQYRRVIQSVGRDTINILEFDSADRLVFKVYRQYISEDWNDRYITIIEGNIYVEGKISKTIYLHSNSHYQLFKYGYDNNNISHVTVYQRPNPNRANTNSNWKIKDIKSFRQLLSYVEGLGLDDEKHFGYELKRDFKPGKVIDYVRDVPSSDFRLMQTHYLDSLNRVTETEHLYHTTTYSYNELNKISTLSKLNKGSADKEEHYKYLYKGDTAYITHYLENTQHRSKILLYNNTIYQKFFDRYDSTNNEINIYKIDEYGIPFQLDIIGDDEHRDTTYIIHTNYE